MSYSPLSNLAKLGLQTVGNALRGEKITGKYTTPRCFQQKVHTKWPPCE